MATAQKLTDHFLTCTTCHEIFTDPSTLDCGHSFCGQCIVSFTKTKGDAIRSKSIPCPFCRRLTRVPDPSRPVEEWAEQMRPAPLLKDLLDTVDSNASEATNCDPCLGEGETTPAVGWCSVCDVSLCSNCLNAHRRIPASRHHELFDMNKRVKVKRKIKFTCKEHKEEFVKFFCRDCRRTLCQSCCILYHRKCESVVSLESMLPEMRIFLETRRETLINKSRNEDKHIESLKSRVKELDEFKSSIQSQIRSTAQRVIEGVKKKEKALLDKLNEVTDKQKDQLNADMKTVDMASKIFRQQSYLIDQTLSYNSEMGINYLYTSFGSEAAEYVRDVKKRGLLTRIKFSQNMDGLARTLSELSLGKIEVLDEVDLDTVSTPVLSHSIDCRNNKDQHDPHLSDIVSMEVEGTDTLIVSDFSNKCIKSFCMRNNQEHCSRLKMKSSPRQIAHLEDNQLAVTLPDSKQIAVVSVTPDLTLDSTIRTQKKYIGLTALTPTTLAAGSDSPPCVDILDRSGNVMRSINPIHNGQEIIQKPYFLCTTRQGNILISDDGTKSVVCVTTQGEVVFNYSPTGDRQLKGPRSITSTARGHILVVDYYRHTVIQLSGSGEFVRDLLTSHEGIFGPWCLDWDERGIIFVIYWSADNGVNIQVFTLK